MSMRDDIMLAQRLAEAAGAAIRPYWRVDHGLEAKDDATPVTLADRAAEAAMRAILSAERPDDGIVGEEYGSERPGASRQWVLDPIDGTTSFVAGRPIFGTLIALMQGGFPVMGIIDQPISGERWIGAAGMETTLNGQLVRATPVLRWRRHRSPPPARIISMRMMGSISWRWRHRPRINA